MKSSHHAALFTELIFNYGDVFHVEGQHIENVMNRNEHQIISGLKTEPFHTEVSGEYHSIGLILKPYCYGILIEKFGTRTMELISELLHESFFGKPKVDFEWVERHLYEMFGQPELDTDLVKFEQYLSTQLPEKGTLRSFNQMISITQKGFIQKFKKYYLLTPNDYLKLKRVNAAVRMLHNKGSRTLLDVGLDSGFYDQSHFIRLFKKFCGYTPKEFSKNSTR